MENEGKGRGGERREMNREGRERNREGGGIDGGRGMGVVGGMREG